MSSRLRLSICIATYNRASMIAQTLDSIVGQLAPSVELVLVDGASPDETESVVTPYLSPQRPFRYIRESENSGVDADYDKAVGYARGDYCWLMTDDDLLVPHAVERVLAVLSDEPDLVVANAEVLNADLSRTIEPRSLAFDQDRSYASGNDRFLVDVVTYLSFIGAVVIKRDLWLERNRTDFYGSLFVHVGVICQSPALSRIHVIAEPLISIRYGNAMWTARGFEIWMFKWPSLIWGFPGYSDSAKARVTLRDPWKSSLRLVRERGIGSYSIAEFSRFIPRNGPAGARFLARVVGLMPGWLANAASGIYCMLFSHKLRLTLYDLARSRHATWISRRVARLKGVS